MKPCKNCKQPRWHSNPLIALCKTCVYKKSEANAKQTRIKQVSSKRAKRLSGYSEKDMFMEIWKEQDHICTVCNKNIQEPQTFCFAHKAPKWTYPEHRLQKDNIALVCSIKCHWEIDKIYTGIARQEVINYLKDIWNK